MKIINARIVNVFSGKIELGDIVIKNGKVNAILHCETKTGTEQVYDAKGGYVLPGLIDAHGHIEMSYLNASNFAKAVLPTGTTGAVLDPHDIMNALGVEGVELLVNELKATKLKGYFMAPPCIPSAPKFEDAFGKATLDTTIHCIEQLGMNGIAEVMDFDRVIEYEPELAKILDWGRSKNLVIDGHAPELKGIGLQKYLSMGPCTDHECVSVAEMQEKYSLGVYVILRKGSLSEPINLNEFINSESDTSRILLCTDGSISTEDIVDKGYMNFSLSGLVKDGIDPIEAIRFATINVARAYRLGGVGAIAPGYAADLCIVEDLEEFKVIDTFVDGERITESNMINEQFEYPAKACQINRNMVSPDNFSFEIKKLHCTANVLHIIDGTLATDIRQIVYDKSLKDIIKVSVINRYSEKEEPSLGLLSGFGCFKGAFAGSIAQDTQNIVVVGDNDEDMALAVNEIIENDGGIIVVQNGIVKEFISLPIGGIMSKASACELKKSMHKLKQQVKKQGCTLSNPVFTISLQIPLAVIPKGAMTNRGLLDVENQQFISVFV